MAFEEIQIGQLGLEPPNVDLRDVLEMANLLSQPSKMQFIG
jgi:hypothetical protein